MTEHEKYQEHIQHTHDVFCKTVIRHAAIDAARSIRSRRKREISLEYLIEEKHYPFSTTDKYFAEHPAYAGYIRSCAKIDGHINTDMQEHIVRQLIESLLKFRFDR